MKRSIAIIGALLTTGILGWYLFSPLVWDTTVNEPGPKGLSLEDLQTFNELESLTPAKVAAMPDAKRKEMLDRMNALSTRLPDHAIEERMPGEAPEVLARGEFRNADSFHKGSGSATMYREANGAHVLRFENFAVTNGPALVVQLVRDPSGDVNSGVVELGKLKGNKGNQNYDIPEDIDVSQYKSVVIWCKPFGVTFSIAPLSL